MILITRQDQHIGDRFGYSPKTLGLHVMSKYCPCCEIAPSRFWMRVAATRLQYSWQDINTIAPFHLK